MQTHRVDGTDAFWLVDLEAAPVGVGVVRCAPKVLHDSALLLARTTTYGFACLGLRVSGASAGVNAKGEARAGALGAFVEAVREPTGRGELLFEPGKGVGDDDLAALREVDPRPARFWQSRHRFAAASALAATAATAPLEGRRVALEGLDEVAVAFARAAVDAGARVVGVSTAAGTLEVPDGLDVTELGAAFGEHGAGALDELAGGAAEAGAVFAADADVLTVGSRPGVLDHVTAPAVRATTVVPLGPVPVTARALAVLRRGGTTVLPDFVTRLGALAAMELGEASLAEAADDAERHVAATAAGLLTEVSGHPEGPLLGACEHAEAFLSGWCGELPFGRPLA